MKVVADTPSLFIIHTNYLFMLTYRLASSASALGILLIFTAIIIAQSTFMGYHGESYNLGMHFISELGNPFKNKFYFLLNVGFMIASAMFIPMTLQLGKHTGCRLGRLASYIGVVAMIAIFLVGCIPETNHQPHFIAAISFFTISSIMSGLFAFLSLKNDKLSNYLFVPSLLPVVLFIIFLIYPKTELNNITADPQNYIRPKIVGLAVLEWAYFFAMSFWVLCASHFLWKAGNNHQAKEKTLA